MNICFTLSFVELDESIVASHVMERSTLSSNSSAFSNFGPWI
jgi:hypothetical protein